VPRFELDRCSDDFLEWADIDADTAIEARVDHGPRWLPEPEPEPGAE